jgi:hypothetical protein
MRRTTQYFKKYTKYTIGSSTYALLKVFKRWQLHRQLVQINTGHTVDQVAHPNNM